MKNKILKREVNIYVVIIFYPINHIEHKNPSSESMRPVELYNPK